VCSSLFSLFLLKSKFLFIVTDKLLPAEVPNLVILWRFIILKSYASCSVNLDALSATD